MVLAELGASIANAFTKLGNASTVDDALLDELLKDIGNALIKVKLKYLIHI